MNSEIFYGEISLRLSFITAKFPYGEVSLRLNFHGEISQDENSHGGIS